jgi:large subunit ribosomal protein L23
MHVYEVLRRPVITEKDTFLKNWNKYTFEIAQDANKLQVKEAVEKAFNVTVLDVNTMTVKGRVKRRGRFLGKTAGWKKAVVTLKPGDKIEFFEGV